MYIPLKPIAKEDTLRHWRYYWLGNSELADQTSWYMEANSYIYFVRKVLKTFANFIAQQEQSWMKWIKFSRNKCGTPVSQTSDTFLCWSLLFVRNYALVSNRMCWCWWVVAQRPSNMSAYLRDGSAHAVTHVADQTCCPNRSQYTVGPAYKKLAYSESPL